jgi:acetyltransferase-like isoleucine patch superfamily enzyme
MTAPWSERNHKDSSNPAPGIRTAAWNLQDSGRFRKPGMKLVVLLLRKVYWILVSLVAFPFAFPFMLIAKASHAVHGKIIEPSIVLSRVPFYLGERVREIYYRSMLLSVGKGVTFKYGSFCQYRNTRIGNRVLIGYFTTLGEVSIGDNVLIGGNVNILSGLGQHSFSDPKTLIWDTPAPGRRMITIGSDVWIGSDAVIGNDIGDRCVVAANSFVVRKVKSHTLVGGNPAEILMGI